MKRSGRATALNFNGVKPEENDFLITRIDPFHDKPYLPMGGPGTAPTVVRSFKRSVTLNNPNTASTSNWSFAVGNGPDGFPYCPTSSTQPVLQLRNFENSAANQTGSVDLNFDYGGLNTFTTYTAASQQGTRGTHHPFAPTYAIAVDSPTIQFSTQMANDASNNILPNASKNRAIGIVQFGENVYGDGPSKLISVGYEVHMTTSDLYNTGVVTIGRIPQALTNTTMRMGAIGTEPAQNVAVITSAVMPTNAAELLLYSGSKQWPAKYGVYAVPPIASSSCPDFDPNPFQFHIRREQSWQSARTNTGVFAGAVSTATRTGVTTIASTEHFDTVLALFEGLDPRATLQLTVTLTYETIPTDNELLRPLARMPMEIRPHILEIYDRMMSTVDCFCMVSENASGGFFRKMAKAFEAAKKVVSSPAGKAITQTIIKPIAVQAGLPVDAAGVVNMVAQQAKKNRRRKKKAQQQAGAEITPLQAGAVINPTIATTTRRNRRKNKQA